MTTSNKEQQYTLPHTGVTVPSHVHVGGFSQIESDCGVAYSATLFIDDTMIGTIANNGRGETELRTVDAHLPVWRAIVEGARDRDGEPMSEEDLCDELVTEADFDQQVKELRHSRTKYALRVVREHLTYVTLVRFKRPVRLLPDFVAAGFGRLDLKLPEDTIRAAVHVNGQWVEFYPAP